MKKIILSFLIFCSFILWNITFWYTDLEKWVYAEIALYYNELIDNFENWEIKKEKLIENIKNRVLITKEKHWENLSESFYNELSNLSSKIEKSSNSNLEKIDIPDSYLQIIEKINKQNTQQQNKNKKTTIKKENKDELSEKTKQSIDTMLNSYFKSLEKKDKSKAIKNLENIVFKVDSKIIQIQKTNIQNKQKLLNILNYFNQKIKNQLLILKS